MSVEAPIQGIGTRLGAETNNTPVAGANDTVINTTNRFYSFFTFPASSLNLVTGFECLNGTVVNGTFLMGLEQVDANLPTVANRNLLAWSRSTTQTGTSAVQRISEVSSCLIPGGTIVGAFISSGSATGRFGTTTVASGNRLSAIAIAAPSIAHSTAWGAGTEEPYIKVYYKPVL